MRNIFDQYEQPENRLTHALVTALDQERALLVPFLRWIGINDVSKTRALTLTQQQVPGTIQDDSDDLDHKGLPDAAVFDEAGWAVLFECKVQARTSTAQLKRHRDTAKRNGFESPWIVVISVDDPLHTLPGKTLCKTWRDVYAWFNGRVTSSYWAKQLVDYMQTFERKMLARDYQIRGTITVFDGLRFNDDNPYTYREAKRLIRLLGDLVQTRKDLHAIGVDPEGKRRPAITGRGGETVWDFLPLTAARDAKQFTDFPHLAMSINRKHAVAAITVPNGVKGGFRTKLSSIGMDGFLALVQELEKRLLPILKRSEGAKPMIYATQRHFRSQRSSAEVDARIEADLRTIIRGKQSGVKHQPQSIEAIYQLLVHKRSNIQFGVNVQFLYSCPVVRSPKAAELFVDSWKATSPLIDFVLDN